MEKFQELHNSRSTFEQARFNLVSKFLGMLVLIKMNLSLTSEIQLLDVVIVTPGLLKFLSLCPGNCSFYCWSEKEVWIFGSSQWDDGCTPSLLQTGRWHVRNFLPFPHSLSYMCLSKKKKGAYLEYFAICRDMSCCIKWSHTLIRFAVYICVYIGIRCVNICATVYYNKFNLVICPL